MPSQLKPSPRALSVLAAAMLVAGAVVSAPAVAKKGGIPANGNGIGAVGGPPGHAKHAAPQAGVVGAAAPSAVAPAAPAPTPKGGKPKPAKAKGMKAKGPKRAAAPPAAAAAPSSPAATAPLPAPAAVSAAAPAAQPAPRTGGGGSRAVRRRASAPGATRSPAPAAGLRGGSLAAARGATTARPAPAASPARHARPRTGRSRTVRLFTPPRLRDIAGTPAVTRLVEVVPGFVWLILAGLALVASILAGALAIYARRLRATAQRAATFAGLAATDPLTGLLNRRGFESSLGIELARARRYGGTLALVFADLRALKTINDRHGHEAGDQALRTVAGVLSEQVREGDASGRVGGDEYGVVLVNQGAKGAQAFRDRVRERLSSAPGPHGEELELTMGVALFPDDGDSPDLLLTAADRDLYAQRGIAVR
ncbi:MAG: hypothetical protein QOH13_2113 [Thermoleophilaceae bacterium]|nr:hypothetical protein [Thermoleophilaceae bacterium]